MQEKLSTPLPDDADGQPFMSMPPKGMLAVTCMEKLDIPKVVSTPKIRLLPEK
jgi:hypothetical protein